MKFFVRLFVVTFFLLFSTAVFAEQKIVVMDLTYILNFSKAGKGAQEFLKKSYEDNLKKYSDMEKALKNEETDLLSQKSLLSKEDYTKKSDSLRKKVIDYQSQRRAGLDKIATQRAKARDTLIKAVEPILEAYIKENKVSIVLDKKYSLGGSPENDITEFITEKLNKTVSSLNLK